MEPLTATPTEESGVEPRAEERMNESLLASLQGPEAETFWAFPAESVAGLFPPKTLSGHRWIAGQDPAHAGPIVQRLPFATPYVGS